MNTHSNKPSRGGRGLQLALASILRGLDEDQIRFNYDLACAATPPQSTSPDTRAASPLWQRPRRRSSTRMRAIR